jgi:FtsP/CotA-like multicopper oxidase with cupredoxin domain
MEQFNDTPIVNGTPIQYHGRSKPYRLRILNAANDRFFNLRLLKPT